MKSKHSPPHVPGSRAYLRKLPAIAAGVKLDASECEMVFLAALIPGDSPLFEDAEAALASFDRTQRAKLRTVAAVVRRSTAK